MRYSARYSGRGGCVKKMKDNFSSGHNMTSRHKLCRAQLNRGGHANSQQLGFVSLFPRNTGLARRLNFFSLFLPFFLPVHTFKKAHKISHLKVYCQVNCHELLHEFIFSFCF